MFPNIFIEETNTVNETENVGCDFVFDYESGQHLFNNSSLVECSELQTAKQYIQNVLRTQVNAYKVYTEGEADSFGISIYDYLGTRKLPMGYLNSELKREVTEQLLRHPFIASVTNWTGKRERNGLHIYFIVTLKDGTVIEEGDLIV
ncbi:MAG: DUF2634 domain-containing protein [Clostridia bacterium]|nr:DUF2634 domain-containing protein [Clostridia bacterium]